MARSRRKYNSNRGIVNGETSNETATDVNNLEVLPGKKQNRRQVVLKPLRKRLTKKERKRLEKIVSKKKKKALRTELLENLSKVQVKSSELAMFDSIAHLGTRNSKLSSLSKRPIPEELQTAINDTSATDTTTTMPGLKGWTGRRKRRRLMEKKPKREVVEDESSSESEFSSSSDSEDADKESEDNKSENQSTVEKKEGSDVKIDRKSETNSDFKENATKQDKEVSDSKEELPKKAYKPAVYVHLNRDEKVQEARLQLPILAEEQAIMEAVADHPVVIICGQTGSGKTTQVPQFLYEAGYAQKGLIGITEPRRVAAVSMSKRVAMEMNLPTSQISYQIRYENNITDDTCMKFMTDGVLARELKEDFLLSKYSVIILDEAHERTSNTDVLIGLLSRIVPLRNRKGKPLKLIIMSATLRVQDFTENNRLFKTPPPVIKVDARQYAVTIHFNKRTPMSDDVHKCPYLTEAYKKICKIHRILPPGGILVFLTGRQEVNTMIKKLNSTFPSKPSAKVVEKKKEKKKKTVKIDLDQYSAEPGNEEEDANSEEVFSTKPMLEEEPDDEGEEEEIFMDDSAFTTEVDQSLPIRVLPLYSLLSQDKQRQVFEPVPDGMRLCVVATNVAETSLTIPGIKYIVDTGKVKRKLYDKVTGVSAFRVTWISKASASQRAGRAGRTESGHAYRLYSSAVYQDFPEFDDPEIVSKPVAGLVLQMKSMKIDRVVNFPFPTPPSHESLESAEKLLLALGALKVLPCKGSLKEMKEAQFSGVITPLGRLISSFPVHPLYGKMIAEATNHGNDVTAYIIAIVAALTVQEIFFTPSHDPDNISNKEHARQMNARLKHLKALWSSVGGGPERKLLGDLMVLLGAIGSAEYADSTASFCAANCLRPKAIFEVRKLRHQLTNVVRCVTDNNDLCLDPKMKPPNDNQVRVLRQIVLSALGHHVARKIPTVEIAEENKNEMRGAYRSLLMEQAVFIHPESVLARDPLPEYVVFQEIIETDKGKRSYMRDVSCIEAEWLAKFCPYYCNFSKPVEEPMPRYDVTFDDVMCHVTANYGRLSWPLGIVEISYPICIDRYRWFGRFFLEGEVISTLKQFTASLLVKPATMVKSWAKLQPKTETLLRTLQSREVDSQKKLLEVWKEDSDYLKSAYMEWLSQSLHYKLLSWPPT